MNREERMPSRLQRVTALAVVLIGAVGSFGSMLYASRSLESLLLKGLFAGWLLAPFVALVSAYLASERWAPAAKATLYGVIFLVAAGSLAVYGGLASGTLKAKNGFIFLVVPLAAWLLMGAAFALAKAKSRRG